MEIKELEKVQHAGIFGTLSQLGHEQVVFCHDEVTGLKSIIAIHNTVLGPALGGTRMWNYATEQEALTDVLRLSRGMTFKASISGINLGGGKAVIIGDAKTMKTEAFLRRFGKFVNSLNGKYITAEDVNMKTSDMEYLFMETKHVTGLPESMGGGGDPSPVTAYGVYMGMKAAAKKVYGNDSLTGKRVSVQGVGQVGMHLVEYLVKENADVFITDIFEDKVKELAQRFNVTGVGQQEIYDLDVDIYAPCALGATLNDNTIPRLKCNIVAGAANNQLKEETKHGYMLLDKSVVYAPDFLINAGGLMNVYQEYMGNYNRKRVFEQAEKIYTTCLNILNLAEADKISSQEAAIRLAEKRIADVGRIRMSR
ncbi:Glu/Leu/Phe/Val dehydrogenase dimerization domain-containing protein [Pseudochryseolinea flava]|uniref:Leucine dehydrogenase n=1 Tax=Pseudochryseolinea flava TaxID=2059302 RepID=A0A364Y7G4_9BACT|nr:Glu/Leu/Phe/Val dehydrogenase dimerization domain-containing protein [Pseudochryseolinea flava]RAW03054.1 leucine dehydrogenase [Pseudochryseolinea flava]